MPKTVGGNPVGKNITELELPNTFYAGPNTGNKDTPTFRKISVHDINESTADGVGGKMTNIGANSIAVNMTTTGGNAIATRIDGYGAGVIADTMGAQGAYTIGQNLQVLTTNGIQPLSYTQMGKLVNINTSDMVHAKEALIAIEALSIFQNTMWFVSNASLIASQISTAIITFGVSGVLAGLEAAFAASAVVATVTKIAAIGTSINAISHEVNREDIGNVKEKLDNLLITAGQSEEAKVEHNVVFAGPPYYIEGGAKGALRYLVNADIPTNATQSFITNTTTTLVQNAYTTITFTGSGDGIYATGITQANGVFTNTLAVGLFVTVSFTTFFDRGSGGLLRAHRLKCGTKYYGNQQCQLQIGSYVGVSSSCRIYIQSNETFIIEAFSDALESSTYNVGDASSSVFVTVH